MLDGVGEEVGVDEDGVGGSEGGVVLEEEGGLWGGGALVWEVVGKDERVCGVCLR